MCAARDASFADARETGIPRVPLDAGDDRPRPWRRFFAKTVDLTIATTVALLIVDMAGPFLGFGHGRSGMSALLVSMTSLLIWAAIEILLLTEFGTTLGRRLYRITIRRDGGTALGFDDAVWRTLRMLVFGLGFGIPIVTIVTQIVAYVRLRGSGRTSWDRKGGLRVTQGPMSAVRWCGAIAATLGLIAAAAIIGP